MKKGVFFISLFLTLVLVLASCGGSTTTTDKGAEKKDVAKSDLKVAVVTSAAGQNDSGYNKALVTKVKEMADENGFKYQIVEPTNGVPNSLETLAGDGFNLIFSLEYDFEALIKGVGGGEAIAAQYPDTTFVIFNYNPNVDESGKLKHKNVYSVLFSVNESSYLAGYLYGLVNENKDKLFGDEYKFSDKKVAGFVGGTNSNGILVYSYAFTQGINDAAEEYGSKYDYYATYDSGFTDSALGSTKAATYFDNDANVVFADAGTVGDGITSKAKEVGRLAIQVDADLDKQQHGYVLTSVLKLTDVPAETITKAYIDGSLNTLENVQFYGLATGATDITDLSTIEEHIKDKEQWSQIKTKVEEKKENIKSGKLKVIDAQAGEVLDPATVKNVNIK